jgi:hypothetical protein
MLADTLGEEPLREKIVAKRRGHREPRRHDGGD